MARYVLDVDPIDGSDLLRVQMVVGESGMPLLVDRLPAAEVPAAVEAVLRTRMLRQPAVAATGDPENPGPAERADDLVERALSILRRAPDVPPDPGDELPQIDWSNREGLDVDFDPMEDPEYRRGFREIVNRDRARRGLPPLPEDDDDK